MMVKEKASQSDKPDITGAKCIYNKCIKMAPMQCNAVLKAMEVSSCSIEDPTCHINLCLLCVAQSDTPLWISLHFSCHDVVWKYVSVCNFACNSEPAGNAIEKTKDTPFNTFQSTYLKYIMYTHILYLHHRIQRTDWFTARFSRKKIALHANNNSPKLCTKS